MPTPTDSTAAALTPEPLKLNMLPAQTNIRLIMESGEMIYCNDWNEAATPSWTTVNIRNLEGRVKEFYQHVNHGYSNGILTTTDGKLWLLYGLYTDAPYVLPFNLPTVFSLDAPPPANADTQAQEDGA